MDGGAEGQTGIFEVDIAFAGVLFWIAHYAVTPLVPERHDRA